jgi:hypothetical protein
MKIVILDLYVVGLFSIVFVFAKERNLMRKAMVVVYFFPYQMEEYAIFACENLYPLRK